MRRSNKDDNKKEHRVLKAAGKGVMRLLLSNPPLLVIIVVILFAMLAYTLYSMDFQLTEIMKMYQSLSAKVTDSKANFDKKLFYITTDDNGNVKVTVGYSSEVAEEMAKQEVADATGTGEATSVDVSIDGWYTDVTSGSASTSRSLIADNYYLYDGPPWDVTPGTYIFNYPQAKYDTYAMIEGLGVSGNPVKSDAAKYKANALSSGGSTVTGICDRRGFSQSGSSYTTMIGSVPCIPFCPMPAAIDKNYTDGGRWAQASTPDDSVYNYGNKKCALVVVQNLSDIADSTKWLYFPMSTVDAKAHTYPWGVVQTNIKVMSSKKLQFSRDWSGTKQSSQYNKEYADGIGTDAAVKDAVVNVVANDEMNKTVSFNIWSWYNHGVELYNTSSTIVSKINGYYAVGFMIWGD